jgi:hypothetical protein
MKKVSREDFTYKMSIMWITLSKKCKSVFQGRTERKGKRKVGGRRRRKMKLIGRKKVN